MIVSCVERAPFSLLVGHFSLNRPSPSPAPLCALFSGGCVRLCFRRSLSFSFVIFFPSFICISSLLAPPVLGSAFYSWRAVLFTRFECFHVWRSPCFACTFSSSLLVGPSQADVFFSLVLSTPIGESRSPFFSIDTLPPFAFS